MKILPELRGVAYRASALQYFGVAFNAMGSRLDYGRFNRKGKAALYLSLEMETAYAEFQGGRKIPRPCAMMTGDLFVRNLLDLSADLTACSTDIQNWKCDWTAAAVAHAVDPTATDANCASWRCGDLAIDSKLAGIYFPSTRVATGFNVAVFVDDATAGHFTFSVHDPLDEIRRARISPA